MDITRTHASIILSITGVGLVLTTLVFAALTTGQSISSAGVVKTTGINVYWDRTHTQKISIVDWGGLAPGTTCNRTIYVYNDGTVAEVLRMTTGNWTPSIASKYIKLSWDCEDTVLNHASTVKSILYLRVSSNTTGVEAFNFDIRITGTEST
jgi:hypothetical protein